jgi:hypothetical protein
VAAERLGDLLEQSPQRVEQLDQGLGAVAERGVVEHRREAQLARRAREAGRCGA